MHAVVGERTYVVGQRAPVCAVDERGDAAGCFGGAAVVFAVRVVSGVYSLWSPLR